MKITWACLLVTIGCGAGPEAAPDPVMPSKVMIAPAERPLLTRADVAQAIDEGLGRFLGRVDYAAVRRDQAFYGFSLRGFEPADALQRAGLRVGDVVLKVNGLSIGTPDEALLAFEGLRNAEALVLDVDRAGRLEQVRIPITP